MAWTGAPSIDTDSAAGAGLRPVLHRPGALLLGLLIVAAAQVALVLAGVSPLAADGNWTQLYDADSYARVLRVQQLHDTGGWFDPVLNRLNAPFGQSLHWTHPVDLLMLAGAGIGSLVLPYHDALLYAAALAAALPVALLVERGPWGVWALEIDRISAFHAALAGAALVAVLPVDRAAARGLLATPVRRIGALAAAAGAVGLFALAAFPGMVVHPYDGVDPLVKRLITGTVQADLPLSVATWGERLAFVLDWGPFFPAAVFTGIVLWRRERGEVGRRHAILALFLAVYLASSLLAVRGVAMLEEVSVIPWVEGLAALALWCRAAGGRVRRAAGAAVFAASAVGYWAVAAVIYAVFVGHIGLGAPRPCNYADVAPHLKGAGATVMTSIFDGPEIAYRTGAAAVAGPYHRAADAILDTVRFFMGSDAEARDVARRRKLTHVLLCRNAGAGIERLFGGQPRGILAWLWIGRTPVWLRPVPLPAPLARQYMIYRVLPD